MNTAAIVDNLKASGEDFEWYPTTKDMLDRILQYAASLDDEETRWYSRDKVKTIMDVGAGRGDALRAFGEAYPAADLYAIEKSALFIPELVKLAKVIGTEFHEQTFVSKEVSILFCNPPYSEFYIWMRRLIRECPARDMYFVVPSRWNRDTEIEDAIRFRFAEVKVIHSTDFLHAERRARAKVDLLHIRPGDRHGDSLFYRHFKQQFGPLVENLEKAEKKRERDGKATAEELSEERRKEAEARQKAIAAGGLVQCLLKWYTEDMDKVNGNYQKMMSLDIELLTTLGHTVKGVIETLEARLFEIKDKYWSELFSNMSTVTNRLTAKNRKAMMETVGGFKSIEFSATNIYAILAWVVEHANRYTESQILEVFDDMVSMVNIANYKSNQRVFDKGQWRYWERPKDLSHIALNYRVVLERQGGIKRDSWGEHLSGRGQEFLKDLLTVANLLGFEADASDPLLCENDYTRSDTWKSGKSHIFRDADGDLLFECKAFLKGNIHLRMAPELALRLNVAVGKIRGWLLDAEQAAEELQDPAAAAAFERPLTITMRSLSALSYTPKESA